MSKLVNLFAASLLVMIIAGPAIANAKGGHGGHSGHGGHGGHHAHHGHFHRGFGGWGWGYPYYYGAYYEDCRWVRVRVWRNGHPVWRRAWRCW